MNALVELKQEAIRLRIEERLSIKEIQRQLGVSRGSVSLWLRDYPLNPEEIKERQRIGASITNTGNQYAKKELRREESKYYRMAVGRRPSSRDMMKIAETAVLFRLVLHGFVPYQSLFDGDKVDWLVIGAFNEAVLKVEVRCIHNHSHGLPVISLRCSNGRKAFRRLTSSEFDILVGYDLFSDTAYVFTSEEVRDLRSCVSVSDEAAERWDKLRPCGPAAATPG